MQVFVHNTQKRYPIDAKAVEALVTEVLRVEKCPCDEVSIHFVGTRKICSLHASYFNDPSVTDCITFPIDQEENCSFYRVLGEVFVCPETAFQYLRHHQGVLYDEISLYTVHGLLHLLRYDDIDDKDRKIMREREAFHMKNLKIKNLLLH